MGINLVMKLSVSGKAMFRNGPENCDSVFNGIATTPKKCYFILAYCIFIGSHYYRMSAILNT